MTDLDPVALTSQALYILEQRMVDDPANLPSGALLRLAETLMKVRLAELAAKPPEVEREELSPSEILAMDGLPADRKRQLLQEQYEKAFAEFQRIDAALTSLDDERKESDVQTA